MTQLQIRACWYRPYKGPYKDEWTSGRFHQWGTESSGEGEGNYSVGIVEDDHTHAVVTPTPERIHFGTDPSK